MNSPSHKRIALTLSELSKETKPNFYAAMGGLAHTKEKAGRD